MTEWQPIETAPRERGSAFRSRFARPSRRLFRSWPVVVTKRRLVLGLRYSSDPLDAPPGAARL
jgi:hypothetical protein